VRSKTKLYVIILSALFMTWLLSGPAAALAGDVPGPDAEKGKAAAKPLTFLGIQEDEDADTPAAFSKLSLKLYGGYSHVLAADVNEGSDYYFEIIEAYAAEGFGTYTGAYKPVHGGYNFGADLIYQISPSLGIGLGVGYMRNSSDSLATLTEGENSVGITTELNLTAMPIRLGVFLTFPLGGKLNLTADAGAAYYLGLKLDGTQGLEWTADNWMRMTLEASQRSGADFGFHGSLGFEYKLSPKLGFFVEAVGRYAKFKNFETVTGITEWADGSSDTAEGVLYIATEDMGGYEISSFMIEETPPTDPSYREPKIDLSGFNLQAGFRIRF
jgi:Outer membrane protein beta-barrel domain